MGREPIENSVLKAFDANRKVTVVRKAGGIAMVNLVYRNWSGIPAVAKITGISPVAKAIALMIAACFMVARTATSRDGSSPCDR